MRSLLRGSNQPKLPGGGAKGPMETLPPRTPQTTARNGGCRPARAVLGTCQFGARRHRPIGRGRGAPAGTSPALDFWTLGAQAGSEYGPPTVGPVSERAPVGADFAHARTLDLGTPRCWETGANTGQSASAFSPGSRLTRKPSLEIEPPNRRARVGLRPDPVLDSHGAREGAQEPMCFGQKAQV